RIRSCLRAFMGICETVSEYTIFVLLCIGTLIALGVGCIIILSDAYRSRVRRHCSRFREGPRPGGDRRRDRLYGPGTAAHPGAPPSCARHGGDLLRRLPAWTGAHAASARETVGRRDHAARR